MKNIMAGSARRHPCSLRKVNFEGWPAHELANGLVQVFVVPKIGGRIIQMRLGEEPFLYINPRLRGQVFPPEQNGPDSGWKNYGGSKVWPAPQGWSSDEEWPGPPDPILDGSPFDCRIAEESPASSAIHLTSPHDEYTGLTFSREIRIFRGSAEVQISHTMKNTSRRPVRWSIWQVTQHDAHPDLAVFLPATAFHKMFGDQEYPGLTIDSATQAVAAAIRGCRGEIWDDTGSWMAGHARFPPPHGVRRNLPAIPRRSLPGRCGRRVLD